MTDIVEEILEEAVDGLTGGHGNGPWLVMVVLAAVIVALILIYA